MALFTNDRDQRSAHPAPRRSGVMVGLAILLPVILFTVIQSIVIVNDRRAATETVAMARAEAIIDRADAEVLSDMRALAAVGQGIRGVAITERGPTPERARYNAALFPAWTGVLVWSLDDLSTLYSSFPLDVVPKVPAAWPKFVANQQGAIAGGVIRVEGLPVAALHMVVPEDERRLVLSLGVDPQSFQAILMSELPEGAIGALVDREGAFIARSLDFENRIATPATQYVRDAVARGGSGFYRGRTYEGFENYTAYFTSPVTGWSAHVAISSALVDQPQSLSLLVALIGGGVCLLVTAGLVFLVLEDGRRRRRTDVLVQQSQKMETIGQLTGGVAHDFNNLLTVIIGNLEKLRRDGAGLSAEARQSAIEDALGSSRRAAGLTRSLLAYSRQQALAPAVIDVNKFLEDTRELIARSIGEKYDVRCNLDPAAGRIMIDDSQLGSALLNLAVNARDAMPDGGSITISSKAVTLTKPDPALDIPPAMYALITVADNGPGMSQTVAERAFEPFFTTKEVGKGTGLGLAQVDGFVHQSGGGVRLETQPGKGLAVHLYIPSTQQSLPPKRTARSASDSTHSRAARILLVEDEAAVRTFAAGLLEEMGHRVIGCSNAEEARARLDEDRFDILFTDVVLPGAIDGVSFARTAVTLQPGLHVLLATGYAGDRTKPDGAEFPILWKPYDADELHAEIEKALRRPSTHVGMKILLVEDEALISMLAADALGEAGHEVVEAGCASDALNLFRADPESFALAVVDLGLPDRPGGDLIKELRDIRPLLPVLVASGKSASVGEGPDFIADTEQLEKPYSPEELVAAVQRLAGAD